MITLSLHTFGCIVATLRKRLRPSTSRLRNYVQATGDLQVRSCLIDGEAVACDRDGLPSFDRVRYRRQDGAVFLYAFDLLELDGWTYGVSRSRSASESLPRCCAA